MDAHGRRKRLRNPFRPERQGRRHREVHGETQRQGGGSDLQLYVHLRQGESSLCNHPQEESFAGRGAARNHLRARIEHSDLRGRQRLGAGNQFRRMDARRLPYLRAPVGHQWQRRRRGDLRGRSQRDRGGQGRRLRLQDGQQERAFPDHGEGRRHLHPGDRRREGAEVRLHEAGKNRRDAQHERSLPRSGCRDHLDRGGLADQRRDGSGCDRDRSHHVFRPDAERRV